MVSLFSQTHSRAPVMVSNLQEKGQGVADNLSLGSAGRLRVTTPLGSAHARPSASRALPIAENDGSGVRGRTFGKIAKLWP